eukprot:CAMPEP_0113984306 /NCGR_PEP_ID=MMETSP0328-20130328/5338_1 /TAXON_ID=39455 /ORGANISM="Alexandrium minutum" /LENGTH=35 /assembly_acc=CAM_ASM_000350
MASNARQGDTLKCLVTLGKTPCRPGCLSWADLAMS